MSERVSVYMGKVSERSIRNAGDVAPLQILPD